MKGENIYNRIHYVEKEHTTKLQRGRKILSAETVHTKLLSPGSGLCKNFLSLQAKVVGGFNVDIVYCHYIDECVWSVLSIVMSRLGDPVP